MRPALAVSAALFVARVAAAQCPDGSPPPCAARVAAVQRPVDPNRIAVFPFRVATSDTLLGEGFAELLATEFSSDEGPRAVDMATLISAWRRAGGGLRTPLSREKALGVARELGAGLISDGSIVGLGNRITITTNIVATNGSPRGQPTVVRSSADSIDHALRLTASGLVAALGGEQRSLQGSRYTESAEAMRHYLNALTMWRRGQLVESQWYLERAMALDTTFAQAAFRSYLASGWAVPPQTIPIADVTRRAFMLRDRLSAPERAMLEAILGLDYPQRRPYRERIQDQTRVANQLPDNPIALFLAGDAWYHYGVTSDYVGHIERGRELISRSAAIDSQATALRHLIEIAVATGDTAELRRLLPAYGRSQDTGRWGGLFLGYSILNDESALAQLRRSVTIDESFSGLWPIITAGFAPIAASRFDEMIALWQQTWRGRPIVDWVNLTAAAALVNHGRPAAAERRWSALPASLVEEADRSRLAFAMTGFGAGLDVSGALQRQSLRAASNPTSLTACEVRVYRLLEGAPAVPGDTAFTGPCARALSLVNADVTTVAGMAKLERTDSLMQQLTLTGRGYDVLLLARAWERAGKPRRALNAIRYQSHGSGYFSEPMWLAGEIARIALTTGDTAVAVTALGRHLRALHDVEPSYAARRDSLRSLYARLR